jgi:hypothetical protein
MTGAESTVNRPRRSAGFLARSAGFVRGFSETNPAAKPQQRRGISTRCGVCGVISLIPAWKEKERKKREEIHVYSSDRNPATPQTPHGARFPRRCGHFGCGVSPRQTPQQPRSAGFLARSAADFSHLAPIARRSARQRAERRDPVWPRRQRPRIGSSGAAQRRATRARKPQNAARRDEAAAPAIRQPERAALAS